MTTRDDFSPIEWVQIKRSPFTVAGIVTSADLTVVSAIKEIKAFVQELTVLREAPTEHELVATVLQDADIEKYVHPHDRKAAVEKMLGEIEEVTRLVDERSAADEAQAFKKMLWHLANLVANASGEGLFGTGEKVSAKEAKVLARLRGILGLD